jgi:hypothetical protein
MNDTTLVHHRKIKTKEEFMIVYLKDAKGLFGNLSNTAIHLLALIWRDCEFSKAKNLYPGNTISLRKPIKETWALELKTTLGSVNNMLTQLIKDKVLIQQESPIYTLDPKRFFKGTAEHRRHALSVMYHYEIEDGI